MVRFDAWMNVICREGQFRPRLHRSMQEVIAYLDDVGIWPLFQSDTPPFPVPTCEDGLPEVGYMNRTSIKQHVESEFGQLCKCNNPGAEDARDELLGILESLAEDNLDLLAIFVEN